MADGTHRLERRSKMLAGRMQSTSRALGNQLGGHPFTSAMSQPEALAWWAQHRNDQYGAQVLRQMDPTKIAELDAALYRYVNAPQEGADAQAAG